jgi:opacity protein-like surface antigen
MFTATKGEIVKKILLVFSFAFISGSLRAETGKGSNMLAIFGGGGYSTTDLDLGASGGRQLIANGGGTWGGQWIYFFRNNPALGIGIDGSSTRLDDRDTLDLVIGKDATSHLHSTIIMAVVKLAYPTGHVRPYIFGGLGGHRSSVYLAAQPYSSNTWADTGTTERRVLVDETKSSLALGYGVGFDVFFTDEVFVGVEYRGTFLGHDDFDETPGAQSAGLRLEKSGLDVQALLLRAGFKFGS